MTGDQLPPIAERFRAERPRYPELSGKVALVTGSSQGIGLGTAIRLAAEGMRVVITGLDTDDVQRVTAELRALGAEMLGLPGDLAEDAYLDSLVDETVRAFGPIDVLVNNAAHLKRTRLADMPRDLLDRELAVNIRAPLLLAQRTAAVMPDGGCMINISSVGGLRVHEVAFPYDMTKGAIDALTRSLAIDLAPRNIRVNAVAPGSTLTERTIRYLAENPDGLYRGVMSRIPLGRAGTLAEYAGVIAFLASPDAAYITGQVLYVDGGITTQLSPPGLPL